MLHPSSNDNARGSVWHQMFALHTLYQSVKPNQRLVFWMSPKAAKKRADSEVGILKVNYDQPALLLIVVLLSTSNVVEP